MKRTPEELLAAIRSRIGDDLSEEALTLLEDATDTLNSVTAAPEADPADAVNWQEKYESLAKRYKERFVTGSDIVEEQTEAMEKDTNAENITFNDLFKEREGK